MHGSPLKRLGNGSRSSATPVAPTRCTTRGTCCGSRGRRCRCSRGRCGRAAAASTADSPSRPCRFPASSRSSSYVSLLAMPDPKLIHALPLLVPCALLASLDIDSLRRGFSAALDWFGILTFGLLAIVVWGIWIDARLNGMSPAIAALFRDTEIGFQPTFHLGSVIARDVPDAAVGHARAPGAAQQPPRAAQLGGRRHAGVGAVLDDLAAVSRFAALVSRDDGGPRRRTCRAHGCVDEPQPRRSAARAAVLFRGHRDGARGNARPGGLPRAARPVRHDHRRHARARRLADRMAGRPPRRRNRALRALPKEHRARREIHRRSDDRSASPATAATAPRRSAARSTSRAAARTAATAAAAAASMRSPIATSTR